MADDLTKGLFVAPNLNPFRAEVKQRFCKIIGISIYSIQRKVSGRFVAYKVGYWDEEPKTEDDFKAYKLFRSESNGFVIFCFNVDQLNYSVEDLYSLCMKDFILSGYRKNDQRNFVNELQKFKSLSLERSAVSKLYFGSVVKVWDIFHRVVYTSKLGNYPTQDESMMYYRGNYFRGDVQTQDWSFGEKDYLTFPTPYRQPLYEVAIKDFDTVKTHLFCKQHFVRSMS